MGEGLEFDSYMVKEEDLTLGELRLLEVDNRMVISSRNAYKVDINCGGCIA